MLIALINIAKDDAVIKFLTTILVVFLILYYQNGNIVKDKAMTMKTILGNRLRELRIENNLTQVQCAESLGIHPVTYLHYEKEQREPPLSLLVDIAIFYNVSVDYLLGLSEL